MRQIFSQKFWRDRRGQVAIILALSLLPLIAAMGFAIDASRQVNVKLEAQRAVDIAALAGAHAFRDTSNYLEPLSVALAALEHNLPSNDTDVTCEPFGNLALFHEQIKMGAQCEIPTTFGAALSGRSHTSVRVTATAKASITTLDMALVLDTSSSMRGSKLQALKDAANKLVDDLITTEDRVRISVVPYSSGVNASRFGHAALGRAEDYDPEGDGIDRVCVSERGGDDAFTDTLADSSATYVGAPTGNTSGCPTLPILPLTNNKTQLKGQINGMWGNAYTAGHIGAAWGWYSISPNWKSMWPAGAKPTNYGNPDDIKAVVLMSDGEFNLANISTQGNATRQARKLCTAMKRKGVLVFTIAFDTTSVAAHRLMENCATNSTDYYFPAADEAALKAAFEQISSRFQGVGLTH